MGSVSGPTTDRLQTALDEAHSRYTQNNPLSKKSHAEACLYMPGGNTRTVLHTTPFPLTIASGRSCYLSTVDGHELVDFLGEYTAGIYGHNHPVIRRAIEGALDGGWNYGGHNRMEQQLAQIVCSRFPAMEMVRFVNSGTEANMMVLATALVYTGRKKILVFNKGYHGSTISGRVVSGKPSINLPHDFVVGRYNDVEGTKRVLDTLPGDSLAAILVEPMLGSGGCYTGTRPFLKLLREMATKHHALLIFDEVMTSRLSYHGLGEQIGIKPDLMTIGKWVGGGMSFGAFGGRDDVMGLYDPRKGQLEHPGTFNNNVFSMSAGIAGCRLLDKNRIQLLNGLGVDMRMAIEYTLHKYNIVGQIPNSPLTDNIHDEDRSDRPPKMFVKGNGSILVIHFTGPDHEILRGIFFHHMMEQGIYLAQRGFISLNIELNQSHVDKFVAALDEFCQTWQEYLRW